MKWFYGLSKKIRIVIAVAAWIPLIVSAAVIGAMLGGKTDNINGVQSAIILVLLAVGIFFAVFAAKATSREKSIEKEKQATIAKAAAEAKAKERAERLANIVDFNEGIKIDFCDNREYSTTPIFSTRLTRNGNEDMQDAISTCNVGDDVDIELDNDNYLYLCSVNGVDVGYLPEKISDDLSGACKIKVVNISENDNGKYSIKVDIFPLAKLEKMRFPINSKIRGVTFLGRQEYLKRSKANDPLMIKHTPTDEYPDTISITNVRTGDILGNVGSELAQSLLYHYGDDCAFIGKIMDITSNENGNTLGCNIKIDGANSLYAKRCYIRAIF